MGFEEFEGLEPGKIIRMKDKDHKFSKALVELDDSDGNLSGYMVVEKSTNLQVVEFALGDVHPLLGVDNSVYYLGPVNYAEDIGSGKLRDLTTKIEFSTEKLKNKNESRGELIHSEGSSSIENTTEGSASPSTITDYEYENMTSVPDYIQADNTSMLNDCVPTSAANVLMYWDKNGYPNMSITNSWKAVANAIGNIMNHSDETGVSRSEVVPGLKEFISTHGYSSSFNVYRDSSVSFSDIKNQVNNGNPSMMSVNDYQNSKGGHNLTLVGFEEYYDTSNWGWHRSVMVRDMWRSTPKTVWFSYGSEDLADIYKINE